MPDHSSRSHSRSPVDADVGVDAYFFLATLIAIREDPAVMIRLLHEGVVRRTTYRMDRPLPWW